MSKIRKLSIKQKRFIENYLRNDGNATQAVIDAGYRVANKFVAAEIGKENLMKPYIKVEIDLRKAALIKKIEKDTEISQEKIAKEFAKVAFVNMVDFLDEKGDLRCLNEVERDKLAAVESIQMDIRHDGGKSKGYTEKVKFRLHSKLSALESLAKHINFFAEDNSQQSAQPAQIVIFAQNVGIKNDTG